MARKLKIRGVPSVVFAIVAITAIMGSPPAFGKSLYVNASTGADTYSWATNDAAHPWQTLTRACALAVAGDTVYIAPGTYTGPGSGTRFTPTFNPANSGTAANPITFVGSTGVVLRQISGDGPLIGANSRNYITWKNLLVDENNYIWHPDTGTVALVATTGSVIDNVTVVGRNITTWRGVVAQDNRNGVRLENATNCTVKNSRIYGVRGGWNNHNTCGIMLYYCTNITIENNEIYDTYAGVYPKGGNNNGVVIRYNLIHDLTTVGIRVSYSTGISAYQNIIYNTGAYGIQIAENTTNSSFNNNTIDGSAGNAIGASVQTAQSGITLLNNIVHGAGNAMECALACASLWASDYNSFYSYTQFSYNGTAQNIAGWRSLMSPGDSHSSTTNPLFVNRTARDYRLQAGSPARTASNTGGPIGAYISGTEIIGPSSSSSSPVSDPSSPPVTGIDPPF